MSETFSKIILTNSNVEGAVPSSGDLSYGEIAINYKDGKIFFKDADDIIDTIATTQVISDLDNHKNNTSNPHSVTKVQLELGNVNNTSDLSKPISNATQTALNLKADKVQLEAIEEDVQGILGSNFISFGDLIVTAEGVPSGNGALTYNNQTGEFTYTPPALSEQGGITFSSLSVGTEGTASGNGGISYNNQTGVFTYTPPVLNGLTATGDTNFGSNKILYSNVYSDIVDLPDAATYHGMFAHVHATGAAYFAHAGNWIELANLDDTIITLSADTPLAGDGSLTYDPNTRDFIYDQPTLAGLGGQPSSAILDDLDTLGTVTGEDRFIVSTGDGVFAYQTGSTVRDSLGLGIDDTPEFNGVDINNINIDGNTISSTDTNGDINITPNGAGKTVVDGQLNATSFKLSGGGVVDLFQKFSSTQDFGSISADAFEEVTITATGVSPGDFIFTSTPPGLDQHLLSSARCATADEIILRVYNMDNQAHDPASTTWYFLAVSIL